MIVAGNRIWPLWLSLFLLLVYSLFDDMRASSHQQRMDCLEERLRRLERQ